MFVRLLNRFPLLTMTQESRYSSSLLTELPDLAHLTIGDAFQDLHTLL